MTTLKSAYDAACGRLACRMRTEKEIRDFLETAGYETGEIAEAVSDLKNFGYIDDARFCEEYFRYAKQKAKADARIIRELSQKGITAEFARNVIEDVRVDAEAEFEDDETSAMKTAAQMLTQASNLKEAIEVLEKGMKGTLADYEIASVTETALMDIFPYDAEDDKDTDKTADANNPSVRKFFQSLPEGCKTEITVSGKKIIVDKTGRDMVVTPSGEG